MSAGTASTMYGLTSAGGSFSSCSGSVLPPMHAAGAANTNIARASTVLVLIIRPSPSLARASQGPRTHTRPRRGSECLLLAVLLPRRLLALALALLRVLLGLRQHAHLRPGSARGVTAEAARHPGEATGHARKTARHAREARRHTRHTARHSREPARHRHTR